MGCTLCSLLCAAVKHLRLSCRLYSDVITTIEAYGNLLWADVVAQVGSMNEKVLTFQMSSKKLPKGLRDWPAYLECKRTIDEYLELLPLFQQLANKALRSRFASTSSCPLPKAFICLKCFSAAC